MEILLNLDSRTLILMIGLMYLILPVFTWILLAGRYSSLISFWCGGGILIGLASALLIMRGQVADILSISVYGLVLVAGGLLRIHSLHLDLGLPWSKRLTVAVMLVYFSTVEILRQSYPASPVYAQLNSLAFGMLALWIAVLNWRLAHIHESRSCSWIAGAYLLLALCYLLRLHELVFLGLPNEIFSPSPGMLLLFVIPLFTAVIGDLGYIGYWLDRAHHREKEDQLRLQQEIHNRMLVNQIGHLERQRSLGEMAASIGHEVSQPLNVIKSYSQLGMEMTHLSDDKRLNELFSKIEQSAKRAAGIIERIRNYIRPLPQRMQTLNMNEVVSETCELLDAEIRGSQTELKLKLADHPVWVLGDSIQLSQIIFNLLRNAIDASISSANRIIEIESSEEESLSIVRIRDYGPGFSEAILNDPGKPFVSTKDNGLGLGLSIAKGIAQQHGGSLTFLCHPKGGAMVELRLSVMSR